MIPSPLCPLRSRHPLSSGQETTPIIGIAIPISHRTSTTRLPANTHADPAVALTAHYKAHLQYLLCHKTPIQHPHLSLQLLCPSPKKCRTSPSFAKARASTKLTLCSKNTKKIKNRLNKYRQQIQPFNIPHTFTHLINNPPPRRWQPLPVFPQPRSYPRSSSCSMTTPRVPTIQCGTIINNEN